MFSGATSCGLEYGWGEAERWRTRGPMGLAGLGWSDCMGRTVKTMVAV